MKNIHLIFIGIIALALSFSACKKDETPTTGDADIQYNFVWGSSQAAFDLNQELVHPGTGDTLTFSMFKFIVSNIRLKNSDGTWWEEDNSYHIVCHDCSGYNKTISINDIPTGDYVEMEYTLGVDSPANVSGAQTGALDPSHGMFWDWNSGYRMIMAEGHSPQSSTGAFMLHLGGFSGSNNIINEKSTTFNGATLTVNGTATPTINMTANPARLWHGGGPSVSVTRMVHMPGATATTMGNNFFGGVTYTSIQN